MLGYLNARDIPINVLFFQVFEHNNEKLLSRAWLISPEVTQVNASLSSKNKPGEQKEPWNGEFYVSYGGSRSWDQARKFGFVSAGGGSWYSQTLTLLSPDDRIWVKIPKTGYVGVGRVVEPVQTINDFTVKTESGVMPIMEVEKFSDRIVKDAEDPEKGEKLVRVEWMDTVPQERAFDEVGLFGNQNTVCQPTAPKWRHTVERLKTYFKNLDKTP